MAQFYKPRKLASKSQKNRVSSLVIDKNDHHGKGIVLTTTPITLVEGALKDETVTAETYQHSKKVQKAKLVKIDNPSPHRTEPFCNYYGLCGGCSMQHSGPLNGLYIKFKALNDYLCRQLTLSALPWQPPVLSNIKYEKQKYVDFIGQLLEESILCSREQSQEDTGYRRRVKLSIDARNKHNIKVGFRKKLTNDVVDVSNCPIATLGVNQLIKTIRAKLKSLNNSQIIGHIVITEGSEKTQAAFYLSKHPNYKAVDTLLEIVQSSEQNCIVMYKADILASSELVNGEIVKHFNSQVFEAKIGKSEQRLCASLASNESIALNDIQGLNTRIKSHHFLQVNRAVNSKMLQLAKDWLQPSKKQKLYDFYCGSGNFSLFLASFVDHVYGFEGVPEMVVQASENADLLAVNNCEFNCVDLSADYSSVLKVLANNSIVILDPAREGALQLCQYLSASSVNKILYVSCNANSFSRDATHLLTAYSLEKIACLDMFPFTEHIELIALFERRVD